MTFVDFSTADLGAGLPDATALMNDAARHTGLADYGDPDLARHLDRYLQALSESGLPEEGMRGQVANVHRILVNRLRMQDDLTKHPEILDEEIIAPIFVVGLPRTGTTKLQRLLSQDPESQVLRSWRALNPAPIPGWDGSGPDPRIEIAKQHFGAMVHTDYMMMHPTQAEEADEDFFLLAMRFDYVGNALAVDAPTYWDWVRDLPQQPAYGYHRRLLQYLQWQDGGGRDRPWVLKSPGHTGHLDAVIDTYPDATVVHCLRPPPTSIASFCRLLEAMFDLQGRVDIDRAALGAWVLRIWAVELEKHVVQRQSLGDRLHIIDLPFETIVADAPSAIRGIYAQRGRKLSGETASRILEWERNNPPRRDEYTYALADYGLTVDLVNERLAPYVMLIDELRHQP